MKIFQKISYRIGRAYYNIKRIIMNLHPDIYIGKNTIIENGAILSTRYGGSISIGEGCHISNGAQILTCGGKIEIGNYSTVNPYAMVYGQGCLKIGNGVRIATQSAILPSNHIFSDRESYIYKQGLSSKGIVIEDDVWIGSGVKVLDGVTIRKGCVIGANSVVTKSTEEYGIYVGISARKIRNR